MGLFRRRTRRGPCRQCGTPTPLPYGVPRDDVRHPVRCAPCAASRQQVIDAHMPRFIAAADAFVAEMRRQRGDR